MNFSLYAGTPLEPLILSVKIQRIGQSAGNLDKTCSLVIWWSISSKGVNMGLHKKQLGSLGELKIAYDLVNQGYFVFKELGDNCKSDLIVLDNAYVPIKVQVKCLTTRNGAVQIKSSKDGPSYHFDYQHKHADIYAIYVIDKQTILYISNTELLKYSTLTIRVEKAKNNQEKVNKALNYSDFKRALRDCTRDILPGEAEDNDTVQPTTAMASES